MHHFLVRVGIIAKGNVTMKRSISTPVIRTHAHDRKAKLNEFIILAVIILVSPSAV